MKTKTHDIYLHEGFKPEDDLNGDLAWRHRFSNCSIGDFTVKAKLVIELPEPKIEITPSDIKQFIAKEWTGPISSCISKELVKHFFGADYEE